MKNKKLIVTLIAAGMLFAGCGVKNSQAIIKINNTTITQKDFDNLMDKQIAQSPFAKMGGVENFKKDKEGMLYLMTEQRVLNQLIIETLLNQEADKRGIKVSKQEVDEEINKIMDKMGGKDQLMDILKQNDVSVAQFKKDVKNQVRMQKLAKEAGNIKVSEADAKKYYDQNKDKFVTKEKVRASHILIAANPFEIEQELKSKSKEEISDKDLKAQVEKVQKERKEKAQKLAKELKADKSKFAAYAKKYSQDPGSAKQGGDLGFFAADRMVPEFSKVAFSAKPDTVSDVVSTQFGYHIILVTDRKAAGTVPFEKVKSDVIQYLISEKEIKALDDLTNAAKKESDIKFFDKDYDPEVVNEKLMKSVGGLKEQLQGPKKPENKPVAKKAPAKK